MPRSLRILFFVVDLGFVAYWLVSAFHLVPASLAFKDYDDPILHAWNWSFLPLDLLVSATRLSSLGLARRDDARWKMLALLSLALTCASGLQALAFWAIRRDFDVAWWLPNAFLLLYPLPFVVKLTRSSRR